MRSPGRPPGWRREHQERFWEGIAGGLSSEQAGVAAGVSPAVGSRWFRENGGMAPFSFVPVSGRYLSFVEREEIAVLHARQCGVREIARRLGRCASTISRELRRNAATRGGGLEYRATTAQWHSDRRASRPKVSKLASNDALREYVQDRLGGVIARPDGELVPGPQVRWVGRRHGPRKDRRWATSWSPEQISGRLRVDFPHNESMRISHEAIYQALYVQGRGALKRELVACLRTGRALRVPRARTRQRGKSFVSPEIGVSMASHMKASLVADALREAIGTRGSQVRGVVFHTDRGSQFTSRATAQLCRAYGIRQSVGRTGVCWDNAAAESFLGTLKKELVNRADYRTRHQARLSIRYWIEAWYNPRRLHSTIGQQPPNEWEDNYYHHTAA